MTDLIIEAIHHYHPEFDPPERTDREEWIKVCCPFHPDNNASAGVNYHMDSFACLACGVKGNWWTLILQQEDSYEKAKRIAAGIAEGSDRPLPPVATGQSRRRVFGEPGSAGSERPGAYRSVPTGIRGRTPPWA